MEATEGKTGIDLFAEKQISLEHVRKVSEYVNSSEAARITFSQQLEENINSGSKKSLAIGIGLYLLGRYKQAIEKLEKTGDCNEKFIYLAFALRKIGKYDQALENLQKSLKHNAEPLFVTMEKAATYRCARNFEAAHNELQNCANLENISAEYHYQLGFLQEAEGLYDQAVENYKKALELSPDHLQVMFRLAYRYDLSGNEDAAIDYYKQIISITPAHVNALLNLTVIYEDMDKYEKADQCIEKILKHHPNHQRALLFQKDIESSKTMFYDEEKEKKKDYRTKTLETPISDFELSVRSRNCFKKMNIHTLGDLMNITESELLSYKNFGETSLKEIKIILEAKGLQLGLAIKEQQEAVDSMDGDELISEQDQGLLSKPIDDLRLTVRARKCVRKLNIHSLGELVRKTEAELLGCKNFGVTSLNEIKKALSNLGLSLRKLD
ncbi:MAG: tetratricopeptide repeat protein [Planctomycetota bacterium]|jgi:DNA-directed RNA polymerase subunit alpha